MLERVCLSAGIMMIALGVLYIIYGTESRWLLKLVVLLGGVLNLGLSIRSVLVRSWIGAAGAFLAAAACGGLLFYLQILR